MTSNPADVDAIVKRAWQAIHNGMEGCLNTAVDRFLDKYGEYFVRNKPFIVDDINAEMVQASFRRTKESAGALDGWTPKELSML